MRPLETVSENLRRLTNQSNFGVPLTEHCQTTNWIKQFTLCPRCKVRYCSEDCRMEALKKYHKVACMCEFREDQTHPINMLNETWKLVNVTVFFFFYKTHTSFAGKCIILQRRVR